MPLLGLSHSRTNLFGRPARALAVGHKAVGLGPLVVAAFGRTAVVAAYGRTAAVSGRRPLVAAVAAYGRSAAVVEASLLPWPHMDLVDEKMEKNYNTTGWKGA